MSRKITFTLDENSIKNAIAELQEYGQEVDYQVKQACMELATEAASNASADFSNVDYVGDGNVSVVAEGTDTGSKVVASGQSVLFLEFGAGIKYGYGHPEAAQNGFGPGTFNPSSDVWKRPQGWWVNRQHTYGNAPAMAMYNAKKYVEQNAKQRILDRLSK